MFPAVLGLASGGILLLSRREEIPPISTGLATHQDDLEIPLSLTRKQWLGFLRVAICGNPSSISNSFRLGSFGMTVRRLCDLGIMENPRVVQFEGCQVWDADWKKPDSLKEFQSSPMLQYKIFVDSIEELEKEKKLKGIVGKEVDDQKISLSGALMLGHRAGLPGIESWIDSSEVRKKFSNNTTAFVRKANGIF